jgi:hypothetical protein
MHTENDASVVFYAQTNEDEIVNAISMKEAKATLAVYSDNPKYSELVAKTPKNAKLPIIAAIVTISKDINNERMQNDATDELTACVEAYKNARMRANGTFFIGESECEIFLYGKEHAKRKSDVFDKLLDNEKTEKTGYGSVPNDSTWVCHGLIKATNVKGQSTIEGNQMLAANFLSGSMTLGSIDMENPAVKQMMSRVMTPDGTEVQSSGMISRESADSLVAGLQLIAPKGTRVGYIPDTDADEFASMVLYDVTPQYTPGMFKVGRGIPRKTNRNPSAQELLEVNLNKYLSQSDSKYADIMVYRVNALSRFNLIRLAEPFQEELLTNGKYSQLGIEHGISRNDKKLAFLNLASTNNAEFIDWGATKLLLEMAIVSMEQNGYTKEVHSQIFIRGSKAEKACDKRRRTKILQSQDIIDIKKGPAMAELLFDLVYGQGKANSIANILASESRMATYNGLPTGVLSNIDYLLREGNNAKSDRSSIKALKMLQQMAVFRPFGFRNGKVKGKSNGAKGTQEFNLSGRIGRNEKQLTLSMVTIGEKTIIGLKAIPLSEGAIKHRSAQLNKNKKRYSKPAKKQNR